MKSTPSSEDWRGVDIAQIRDLLRMSVQERVAFMVSVSNEMIKIQDQAKKTRVQRAK